MAVNRYTHSSGSEGRKVEQMRTNCQLPEAAVKQAGVSLTPEAEGQTGVRFGLMEPATDHVEFVVVISCASAACFAASGFI